MYHTNTEPEIQEYILKSFADPNGSIRVLFATITFGLGVDIKGLHNVIMFGAPTDIDDFVQLSGRAGRDGEQSYSIVIKYARPGSRPTTEDMKVFLNTESCRRDAIHVAFPVEQQLPACDIKHNCCDNCAAKCSCQICQLSPSLSYIEKNLQTGLFAAPRGPEVPIRSVSGEVRDRVKEELLQFREQMIAGFGSSCQDMYTEPDIACGLSKATVGQIVNELHLGFSFSHFCTKYQFGHQRTAQQVWELCNKYTSTCNSPMYVTDEDASQTSSSSEAESEDSNEYGEPVTVYSDSE